MIPHGSICITAWLLWKHICVHSTSTKKNSCNNNWLTNNDEVVMMQHIYLVHQLNSSSHMKSSSSVPFHAKMWIIHACSWLVALACTRFLWFACSSISVKLMKIFLKLKLMEIGSMQLIDKWSMTSPCGLHASAVQRAVPTWLHVISWHTCLACTKLYINIKATPILTCAPRLQGFIHIFN